MAERMSTSTRGDRARVNGRRSRQENGLLKRKERSNRDKRMAELVTKGTFPYTPGILSYLSAKLDMPSYRIREAAEKGVRHEPSRHDRTVELLGLVNNPRSMELKRRHAGKPAAAGVAVGAGRPAHHARDRECAADLLIDRRAGIAGAGAKAGTQVVGRRIDQAKLQGAGLSGGDER